MTGTPLSFINDDYLKKFNAGSGALRKAGSGRLPIFDATNRRQDSQLDLPYPKYLVEERNTNTVDSGQNFAKT